jgi:acyl-CoA dehydrogenase
LAWLWISLTLLIFGLLAYHRASLSVWTISFAAFLIILSTFSHLHIFTLAVLWSGYLALTIILNIKFIRKNLISRYLFTVFRRSMPSLSVTEKEALAAGTVGWDGELFSGMPNWNNLLYPMPEMTQEEEQFLEGPVEQLCSMIDNWDITHHRFNLPPGMWQFLKTNGFFGLIIPKKFGGQEFSAYVHSAILTKISGRSISVATVVAVPNSLGPAELLLHYGTEEQQKHYLPRLAKGIEIPCFALTGPEAGSDASAMPDYGVVCKGNYGGKEMMGIRLNWDKRYITLAPVATVIGLAFKLYDPDHLLGGKPSLGITCALIPVATPGITIGRRHFPLNSAFPNGPIQGKNVFIPLDWIIGGVKMAGQGWRMLVECLATGRAISLPSMVLGGAKVAAFTSGAYARIRNQFHLPIGKFGGVEEALARIAGYTYIMEATRIFTVSAIDCGEKPAVPAAISKYHVTELGRKVINDAMDIHGGKGICMGPRNYLAINYQETPISITVEGANILTRSMIIFGQGAIRCHPYILQEMNATHEGDNIKALRQFDEAIFGHAGFLLSNAVRSLVLGITAGRFAGTPRSRFRRSYQLLTRFSAAFAFVADVAMILLGGSLKRKEKLSARLGDVLSMLYLGSAVLKFYENHQCREVETPVAAWACQYILHKAQNQLHNVIVNFPSRFLALFLKLWIFPLGKQVTEPSDRLGQQVGRLMLNPDSLRGYLAEGAYLTPVANNPAGFIEEVLKKVIAVEEIEHKLYQAIHDKTITGLTLEERVANAVSHKIITEAEAEQLLEVNQLRREVLAVDDFASEELMKTGSEDVKLNSHSNNSALWIRTHTCGQS